MNYLNIWHYIKILFREGTNWEFKDILSNGSAVNSRSIAMLSFWKRVVLAIPSMVICYLLKSGFSSEFIGYTMAALSIFIGLFTNLIIVVYGRYTTIPSVNSTNNNLTQLNIIKLKNFIKQFTFVTGKNLLIATYLIFLMSLILLFQTYLTTNINDYQLVKSTKEINKDTIFCFIHVAIVLILRLQVTYLIIDFFILLLYSLGALFAFLKREYV